LKKIKLLLLCITVGLFGLIILISGSMSKEEEQKEVENTTQTTIPTTTTTTTTKKAKKVVKTTKKKTIKKVATATYTEYQSYARQYGNYDEKQMNCLINLWNRESGWNPNDVNKKSGACGIPQAYPCKKIKEQQGSNDWKAQIRWGVNYIKTRYHGKPCEAWEYFQNHKPHWY